MHSAESFVPNDICLGDRNIAREHNATGIKPSTVAIITGPNMGGKSSYLRTVALTVIMAQIGSFVPATAYNLYGLFDAVHVRMGAADDLASGRSTFMVEMEEVSAILGCAKRSSLVILDEVGRGTSTHDGTALAYATLQTLIRQQVPTLFVTHFPLLAAVAHEYPSMVANFNMAFLEESDENADESTSLLFLYKLTAGIASKSFGLNVARLAGLPSQLVQSAALHAQRLEGRTMARRRDASRTLFAALCSALGLDSDGENQFDVSVTSTLMTLLRPLLKQAHAFL